MVADVKSFPQELRDLATKLADADRARLEACSANIEYNTPDTLIAYRIEHKKWFDLDAKFNAALAEYMKGERANTPQQFPVLGDR